VRFYCTCAGPTVTSRVGSHHLTGMLKGMVAFVPSIRPHIDNLAKLVLDAWLNHNDGQVVKLVVYTVS
jgi:Holliday junction resolvase RusA-like endonuclease